MTAIITPLFKFKALLYNNSWGWVNRACLTYIRSYSFDVWKVLWIYCISYPMRTPKFLTPLMNRRIVLKQKNLLYVLCIQRTLLLFANKRSDPQRILWGSHVRYLRQNSGFYPTLSVFNFRQIGVRLLLYET